MILAILAIAALVLTGVTGYLVTWLHRRHTVIEWSVPLTPRRR